eukprot:m.39380 g.39380  ORF g.39380 m.39380 type:complete len:1029 (+) comp11266_c0_seq1:188-3274(+)
MHGVAVLLAFVAAAAAASQKATQLRVEYLEELYATAIDVPHPRFSWALPKPTKRGEVQTAYRIVVNAGSATVWDSGKVASSQASQIAYQGQPLNATSQYCWTVTWFSSALGDAPSEPASACFDTGIFSEGDWHGAQWIGGKDQNMVRHEFSLPSGVRYARAYVATPSCFVLYVNGKSVGDEVGVCPWMDVSKTVLYQARDIGSALVQGDNAVGLLIGSGFSSKGHPTARVLLHIELTDGSVKHIVSKASGAVPPPGPPAMCQSVPEQKIADFGCPAGHVIDSVAFASFGTATGNCKPNGTPAFTKDPKCDAADSASVIAAACVGQQACSVLASDGTFGDPCRLTKKHLDAAITCKKGTPPSPSASGLPWQAAKSSILADDPFLGTTTDWQNYSLAFSRPHFPGASSWANSTVAASGAALRGLMMPLSTAVGTVDPKTITKLPNGDHVVDFGRNFVGFAAINVGTSAPAGTRVVLLHGEILTANGSVYMPWSKNNDLDQRDVHIVDGKPATLFLQPKFTWHGFQYVQVSGGWTPTLATIKGVVVNTNLTTTGNIEFADTDSIDGKSDLLNKILTITKAGQISNMAAYIPTDCPTREKHGWLGDAQVTAEEAMYNLLSAPLHRNYLMLLRDEQNGNGDLPGAAPGHAGGKITDISWTAAYPLITHWMYKYFNDKRIVEEHYPTIQKFVDMLTEAGKSQPGGLADFYTWGDWCSVENRSINVGNTAPELAAFNYILSLNALSDMATVLGKSADAAKYAALSKEMKPVYHKLFYNASFAAYGKTKLEVQSLTAAPLAMDAVPADLSDSVVNALKENIESFGSHLTFGAVGAKHLLPQLTRHGLYDTAMSIATQTTYPSFGHWIANGATTCWENWSGVADGTHPPPPTHNHIFLCGGVGEWMYRSVAGLQATTPGYGSVLVQPSLSTKAGPSKVTSSLTTMSGVVTSSWEALNSRTQLSLQVQVPVSVEAEVVVPFLTGSASTGTVTEGGQQVWANGKFKAGVTGIVSAAATADGQAVMFKTQSGAYSFMSSN